MENSISRSGGRGKPGTSWNTSGIYATSVTHRYVVQPFLTNLWALVAEINGMVWLGQLPLCTKLSPSGITNTSVFCLQSIMG